MKKEAGTLSQEDISKAEAKAREIQMNLYQVAAKKEMRNSTSQIREMQQAEFYRQQYGDVQDHPQAIRFASGRYQTMIAEGAPENNETINRAMVEARQRFGIGQKRDINNERSKFVGTSSQGTMSSSNNNTFKFDKSTRRMAMSMFSEEFDGDEEKALKKYAKIIGIPSQREAAKLGYNS